MIRSSMKNQYILFTSKSICIQEVNISLEKQGQGHSPMEKITTIKTPRSIISAFFSRDILPQ